MNAEKSFFHVGCFFKLVVSLGHVSTRRFFALQRNFSMTQYRRTTSSNDRWVLSHSSREKKQIVSITSRVYSLFSMLAENILIHFLRASGSTPWGLPRNVIAKPTISSTNMSLELSQWANKWFRMYFCPRSNSQSIEKKFR